MPVTPQNSCCDEFARQSGLTRRSLLKRSAALSGGVVATQLLGEALMQSSFGAPGGNVMVVLSLRGGIDGLGVVVPHGDQGYYTARPNTAVPKNQLLAADAMFGLHPQMAPLAPYFQSGQLAAVQAVGMEVPNRSHFEAMEIVEDADPGSDERVGWVNRMIGMDSAQTALQAVQLGENLLPTALTGPAPALAASDLDDLQVSLADDANAAPGRYDSILTSWSGAGGQLAASAREAVQISRGPAAKVKATPAGTTTYPEQWPASDLARALRSAAKLIRADVGAEVIAIDYGSWDLHNNYGTVEWGMMQELIGGFARSLAAFLDDLGGLRSRVTVVTISEFGRRVAENGNRGFDHGWGNMMLVAGGGVKGGQYYANWPGLGAGSMIEGDLQVTTDYRNVLAEVVATRFPNRSVPALFPGLGYSPVGLMR